MGKRPCSEGKELLRQCAHDAERVRAEKAVPDPGKLLESLSETCAHAELVAPSDTELLAAEPFQNFAAAFDESHPRCCAVQGDSEAVDAAAREALQRLRPSLVHTLRVLRRAPLWPFGEEGGSAVPSVVETLVRVLRAGAEASCIGALSTAEAVELLALARLASFCEGDGEKAPVCNAIVAIFEAAGGRPALQVLRSKAAEPASGRGKCVYIMCRIAARGQGGESPAPEDKGVQVACRAARAVLQDPRSCSQTNAEVCRGLLGFFDTPMLAEAAWALAGDAIQRAAAGGRIEHSATLRGAFGGVPDMLLRRASIAACAQKTGRSPAEVERDEASWELFHERVRQNSAGLRLCKTEPPCPTHHCVWKNVMRRVDCGAQALEAARQALAAAEGAPAARHRAALHALQALSQLRSAAQSGHPCPAEDAEARLIAAAAYSALGDPLEAVSVLAPALSDMPPAVGCKCPLVLSQRHARLLLSLAQAFRALGKCEDARSTADTLLRGRPDAAERGTDIGEWQAEAQTLAAGLAAEDKAAGCRSSGRGTGIPPPRPAVPAAEFAGGLHGRCCKWEWRGVGAVKDEDGRWGRPLVLPQSHLLVLSVREDLLLWDYHVDEIVHWITDLPDGYELMAVERGDSTLDTDLVAIFSHDGCTVLAPAHMPRGGRSKCEVASHLSLRPLGISIFCMVPDHCTSPGCASHLQSCRSWFEQLEGCEGLCCDSAQAAGGGWLLAVGQLLTDSLVTLVYRHPPNDMGPFGPVGESWPVPLALYGAEEPESLRFVGEGAPLLAVRYGATNQHCPLLVRVWSTDTGQCVARLQHAAPGPCAAFGCAMAGGSGLFFSGLVACPCGPCGPWEAESEDEDPADPWGIHVWALTNGKRLSVLEVGDRGRLMDLAIMEPRRLLVSAHKTGQVHVWQYRLEGAACPLARYCGADPTGMLAPRYHADLAVGGGTGAAAVAGAGAGQGLGAAGAEPRAGAAAEAEAEAAAADSPRERSRRPSSESGERRSKSEAFEQAADELRMEEWAGALLDEREQIRNSKLDEVSVCDSALPDASPPLPSSQLQADNGSAPWPPQGDPPGVVHVAGCATGVIGKYHTLELTVLPGPGLVYACGMKALVAFPVPGSAACPPLRGARVLNCGGCGCLGMTEGKLCSRCHAVTFCGQECLKAGWRRHKAVCKFLGAAAPDVQALPLSKGTIVRIQGLAAPHLQKWNGFEEAVVEDWIEEKQRYCVALGAARANVKPANLQLVWYNHQSAPLPPVPLKSGDRRAQDGADQAEG